MKRFWIGLAALALLLLIGVISGLAMERIHNNLADTLDRAADFVQDGQRSRAEETVKQASALWERHHHLAAAFADHEPLEQIDSLFARLEVYCRIGSDRDIADACVQLASLSRDVAESHGIGWWSLL